MRSSAQVDNLIHRAAGPRLREACAAAMASRKSSLRAGSQPILTPAFHLPSEAVIHITGPLPGGRQNLGRIDAAATTWII